MILQLEFLPSIQNGPQLVGRMSLDNLMTLLLMPERINEAFGAWVRDLMDSRTLSLRQTRNRTGVDIDTISRMRSNEVPRVDKVIDFARGFGEDINVALKLAGYPPIHSPVEWLTQEWDIRRVAHPELEIPYPVKRGGAAQLTMDKAREIIENLDREITEGAFPKRPH